MTRKFTLRLSIAVALILGTPAMADGIQEGLADPIVTPLPIPSPIGGLYAGVMATKTEATSELETSSTDCVYPEQEYSSNAKFTISVPQCEDVTTTTLERLLDEDTGASAFVGYNLMLGSFVVGPELGSDGELTTLDVKAGLAVGPNLLVYGFAGGGQIDDDEGATYGAGADYVSNGGWLIGVRGMKSEDLDLTQIGLRLGYSF